MIFATTLQAVATRHQPANIDSKEKLEAAPQQRRLLPKLARLIRTISIACVVNYEKGLGDIKRELYQFGIYDFLQE